MQASELIGKFQYALDNAWGYIYGKSGQMWTQAQQDAASREQTVKYGQRWVGHYVADCSGLFVWAFKQYGQSIYHGSNTMYLSYTTEKGELKNGQRTDGGELIPGTAVFTWKPADQKYGHVGLYVGNGTVIEAYGTAKGVITSRVTDKRWTNWGWLKGVEDGDMPVIVKPTLRKGDAGPYVTLAQTELIQRGYDLGGYGADGKFGNATEKAVKAFQTDWDLAADGVIGQVTWQYLESTPSKQLYSVTVYHLTKSQAGRLKAEWPDSSIAEE